MKNSWIKIIQGAAVLMFPASQRLVDKRIIGGHELSKKKKKSPKNKPSPAYQKRSAIFICRDLDIVIILSYHWLIGPLAYWLIQWIQWLQMCTTPALHILTLKRINEFSHQSFYRSITNSISENVKFQYLNFQIPTA